MAHNPRSNRDLRLARRSLAFQQKMMRQSLRYNQTLAQQLRQQPLTPPAPRNPVEPKVDAVDHDAPPDLIGEVLGYRGFRITAQGDLLSANGHAVWRPGPNRAICSGIDGEYKHQAPQSECGCGFYALHDSADGYGEIEGIVRAWGKIVVHPSGFRAEWVEVVCLIAPNENTYAKRASGYYDVPLFTDRKKAVAYAKEGGHDFIPKKLRPEEPDTESLENALLGALTSQPGQVFPSSGSGSGAASSHFSASAPYPWPVTKTKPKKKVMPGRTVFRGIIAALTLLAGAFYGWVWGDWIGWLAGGLFGGVVGAINGLAWGPHLWRLSRRVRCFLREWRPVTRRYSVPTVSFPIPRVLHARSLKFWADHTRKAHEVDQGDPCPYCGWKLR